MKPSGAGAQRHTKPPPPQLLRNLAAVERIKNTVKRGKNRIRRLPAQHIGKPGADLIPQAQPVIVCLFFRSEKRQFQRRDLHVARQRLHHIPDTGVAAVVQQHQGPFPPPAAEVPPDPVAPVGVIGHHRRQETLRNRLIEQHHRNRLRQFLEKSGVGKRVLRRKNDAVKSIVEQILGNFPLPFRFPLGGAHRHHRVAVQLLHRSEQRIRHLAPERTVGNIRVNQPELENPRLRRSIGDHPPAPAVVHFDQRLLAQQPHRLLDHADAHPVLRRQLPEARQPPVFTEKFPLPQPAPELPRHLPIRRLPAVLDDERWFHRPLFKTVLVYCINIIP